MPFFQTQNLSPPALAELCGIALKKAAEAASDCRQSLAEFSPKGEKKFQTVFSAALPLKKHHKAS